MHQMLNMPEKDFPETYDRLNHIISLPIYPSLRKNDVAKIAKNIIKATQI
jgi:dTDP-4-amino-4,6-dideoxygalactose transaminase